MVQGKFGPLPKSGGVQFCSIKATFPEISPLKSEDTDVITQEINQPNVDLAGAGPRKLAAGVLQQAVQDLRRFHCAKNRVERELYYDAHSWLMSEDEVWPFSFLNVCRTLDLAPENVRHDVIGDVSAGTSRYLLRRCGRAVRRCALAFSQLFAGEISTETSGPVLSDPATTSAV